MKEHAIKFSKWLNKNGWEPLKENSYWKYSTDSKGKTIEISETTNKLYTKFSKTL